MANGFGNGYPQIPALEEEVADLIATYGHEIIQLSDIIYNDIKKDRYQK